MKILVITDHDGSHINNTMRNVLNGVSCLNPDSIDVLVMGKDCATIVNEMSNLEGVDQVLQADDLIYEHMLAENTSLLISEIAHDYTHIFFPSNTTGKNIMPRVAGLLNIEPISDVIEIVDSSTFKRPIYAGNAIATVQSDATIKILTLQATAFDPVKNSLQQAPVHTIGLKINKPYQISNFIKEDRAETDRPELSDAKIIISGGRGMGNKENFKLLYDLADKLGAAVGASRAAVDAEFVPNDLQIGQTGKVVAPQLYIAVGISGAIQHLAGMKDSKVIVAINQDEEAPIFQIADYGLVTDLFEAIPTLTKFL